MNELRIKNLGVWNTPVWFSVHASRIDELNLTADVVYWNVRVREEVVFSVEADVFIPEDEWARCKFSKGDVGYYKYIAKNIINRKLVFHTLLPQGCSRIGVRTWRTESALVLKNVLIKLEHAQIASDYSMSDDVLMCSDDVLSSAVVANFLTNSSGCPAICKAVPARWFSSMDAHLEKYQTSYYGRKNIYIEIDSGERIPVCIQNSKTAVLQIPNDVKDYLFEIGDKSRNMIHKAERLGYYYDDANADDYIDDIVAIRTSDPVRQGVPIPSYFYTRPAKVNDSILKNCDIHRERFYGVFLAGKLIAYISLRSFGEMAQINHLLGHRDHMKNGVMNLAVFCMVRDLVDSKSAIKYVNYLYLGNQNSGTAIFKRGVGFHERTTILYDGKLNLGKEIAEQHGRERTIAAGEILDHTKSPRKRIKFEGRFFSEVAKSREECLNLIRSYILTAGHGGDMGELFVEQPEVNSIAYFLSKYLKTKAEAMRVGDFVAFDFFRCMGSDVPDDIRNILQGRFRGLILDQTAYRQGFKGGNFSVCGFVDCATLANRPFDGLLLIRKVR